MREIAEPADIAVALRDLRRLAGGPSYAEIARRVAAVRARRGVPSGSQLPPKVTVYDCFRPDRRRFDLTLVVDVARALGLDGDEAQRWERRCWDVQHGVEESRIVSVRTDLPEAPRRFVGRRTELRQLTAGGLFAVVGMAGCGKTQLALEAARRLAAGGLQPVVVDLRGFVRDRPPAEPSAALEAVARALGGPQHASSSTAAGRRAYRELLASRRVVLVLDDAVSAEQVRELVVDDPAVTVIVTSRTDCADALGARPIPLGPLDDDAAIEFLRESMPERPTAFDEDHAAAVAGAVGRLPLALDVVAARIAARPGWSLADHAASLVGPAGHVRVHEMVARTLEASHAALSPLAGRCLRLFASQPCPDLGADGIAALVGSDEDEARAAMDELVGASMATRPAADRIALHALVRAFAADRSIDADAPSDRDRAFEALLDHAAVTAGAAAGVLLAIGIDRRYPSKHVPPEMDMPTASAWLAAEVDNLLLLTGETARARRPSIPLELSEALFAYLQRSGRHQDGLILHHRAVEAGRALDDPIGEGYGQMHIGQTLHYLGDPERAIVHLRIAEAFLSDVGDATGRVHAKNALGIYYSQMGHDALAEQLFVDALAIADAAGLAGPAIKLRTNIGVMQRRRGAYVDAERTFETGLRDSSASDNPDAGAFLLNLSEVRVALGRPEQGLADADRALAIATAHGLDLMAMYAHSNRAAALSALGQFDEAIAEHDVAIAGMQRLGNRNFEAGMRAALAETLLEAGRPDAAEVLESTRQMADEVGAHFDRARMEIGLATLAVRDRQHDRARALLDAALATVDPAGPESAEARALLDRLPAEG